MSEPSEDLGSRTLCPSSVTSIKAGRTLLQNAALMASMTSADISGSLAVFGMISKIIESIYWDFGFINHTSLKNVAEFGIKMENGYETMSAWYYGVEIQYQDALAEYLNTFLGES